MTTLIIDLLAMIQMIPKGKLQIFGDYVDLLLQQILSKYQHTNEIHIVPDHHDVSASIKQECVIGKVCGDLQKFYFIIRETRLSGSLNHFLSNSKYKWNLLKFFDLDW